MWADQFALANKQYALEEWEKNEMAAQARTQIANQAMQFNLTDQRERSNFNDMMEWDKEQFGENMTFQKDMFTRNLTQQILDRNLNATQFNTQIEWAKQSKILDSQLQVQLQSNFLTQELAQFNITNAQWGQTFTQTADQLNLDNATRHKTLFGYQNDDGTHVKGQLEIQNDQNTGTQTGAFLTYTLDLMTSEPFVSYMANAGEAGAQATQTILLEVVNGISALGSGESLDFVAFSKRVSDALGISEYGGMQIQLERDGYAPMVDISDWKKYPDEVQEAYEKSGNPTKLKLKSGYKVKGKIGA